MTLEVVAHVFGSDPRYRALAMVDRNAWGALKKAGCKDMPEQYTLR